MKKLILIATVLLYCIYPGTAKAQTNNALYSVYETSFTSSGGSQNPYLDLSASVTFRAPNGQQLTIPMFWDGDRVWRVRFSPNQVGTWTYTTSSADSGLNGRSGSFIVSSSSVKGGLKVKADAPYHFEYQDGTPAWLFGDTNWTSTISHNAEQLNDSTFQNYVNKRASQGFNYIHTILASDAGIESGAGYIAPFASGSPNEINVQFFKNADSRVRMMNEKGITVGLALGWSENLTRMGFSNTSSGRSALERYAKYVAARYSAYNVTFIAAGEWEEFFDWTTANSIGTALENSDPHGRIITLHPGQRATVRSEAGNSWMSLGDYAQLYSSAGVSGTRTTPNTDADRNLLYSEMIRSRNRNKPVINAEYGYYLRDQDGDGVVEKPNSHNRTTFRRASWVISMSGSYFVTGFASTYNGGRRHPAVFMQPGRMGAESDGENDVVMIKKFFTGIDWWRFSPASQNVSGGGYNYLLQDNRNSVLYSIGTTSVSVRVPIVDLSYTVRRYDPRTGVFTTVNTSARPSNGTIVISNPSTDDWTYLVTGNVTTASPTAIPTPFVTTLPVASPTPSRSSLPSPSVEGSCLYGPYTVPGRVEAENFNCGGQGFAYNDSDGINRGGAYRIFEGVDLENSGDLGGGYNIGWTKVGEWYKYKINVTQPGEYSIVARVAHTSQVGKFSMKIDGTAIAKDVSVPSTGGWQTYQDVSVPGVSLKSGIREFELLVDGSLTSNNGNYNYFEFVLQKPDVSCEYGPYVVPGRVEVENFDCGGKGVAYNDTDEANRGGLYRTSESVDIERSGDVGGGYNVGWNKVGEWYKYRINVSQSGKYDITARVANTRTSGRVVLKLGNGQKVGEFAVPNTGGFQTYQDVTLTGISLANGVQTFELHVEGDPTTNNGNYNYIDFKLVEPTQGQSCLMNPSSSTTKIFDELQVSVANNYSVWVRARGNGVLRASIVDCALLINVGSSDWSWTKTQSPYYLQPGTASLQISLEEGSIDLDKIAVLGDACVPVGDGNNCSVNTGGDGGGGASASAAPALDDQPNALRLYVSTTGSDSSNGRQPTQNGSNGPFATIQRAKDEASRILRSGAIPEDGIKVIILGGRYEVRESLVFQSTDSGLDQRRIVSYSAAPGEEVIISGGVRLNSSMATAVSSNYGSRIPTSFRGNVREVRLSGLGISDTGRLQETNIGWWNHAASQLYIDGVRATIARYPNIDAPNKWIYTQRIGSSSSRTETPGQVRVNDQRVNQWSDTSSIVAHSWPWEWGDAHTGVRAISFPDIYMDVNHSFESDRRIAFYNILEEFDRNNEYYIDYSNRILLVTTDALSRNTYISNSKYLMHFQNSSNITIDGLKFEYARTHAILIQGGNNIRIKNNTISKTGNDAIRITSGRSHRVENNHTFNTAEGGVNIARKRSQESFEGIDDSSGSLSDITIENNLLHDFGQVQMAYRPGVKLQGSNMVVRNNEIFNGAGMGINDAASSSIIEYNVLYNLVRESGDMGAYYSHGRTNQKGIVRYNYIHDIDPNLFRRSFGQISGQGAAAVYIDAEGGNFSVYGNIIKSPGHDGVKINSGDNNSITNNIVIGNTDTVNGVKYYYSYRLPQICPEQTAACKESAKPTGNKVENNFFFSVPTAHYPDFNTGFGEFRDFNRFNTFTGNVQRSSISQSAVNTSNPSYVTLNNNELRLLMSSYINIPYEQIGRRVSSSPPQTIPGATASPTAAASAPAGGGGGASCNYGPYVVPGRVEAENYQCGGQGQAYNDSESTNRGGEYRPSEGVDIERNTDGGGGYNLGWTRNGEWYRYQINVTQTGRYSVKVRVASQINGGKFIVKINGSPVSSAQNVPNTGNWQVYQDVTIGGVNLSQGTNTLELLMDGSLFSSNGNYNYFDLALESPQADIPTPSTPSNANSVKVAFVSDTGVLAGQRAVLEVIRNENVEMTVHPGDLHAEGYPFSSFNNNVNTYLGSTHPYTYAWGDHDNDFWGSMVTNMQSRLSGSGKNIQVVGNPSSKNFAVKYKNIKFIIADGQSTTNLQSELQKNDAEWKVCVWHYNVTLMQVGTKPDEANWGLYDLCEQYGAMIINGNEHSYHRTKTLSSLRQTTVDSNWPDPNRVYMGNGSTFVTVVGAGGYGLRPQRRCLGTTTGECAIWAKIRTTTQGAKFGALFVTFNSSGNREASAYFKEIDGNVTDRFTINR